MKKVFIACDHAAFETKEKLKLFLNQKYVVIDLGTDSIESVPYPVYAEKLAREIQKDVSAYGILLCGSGVGVSLVANRFKGVRAALCRDEEDVKLAREHNNANVLCLGARKTDMSLMEKMIKTFFQTDFAGGRHQERLKLFENLGS